MRWRPDVALTFPEPPWRPECHMEPSMPIATPPSFTDRKRALESLVCPLVRPSEGSRTGLRLTGCASRRVSPLSPAGQEPRLVSRERSDVSAGSAAFLGQAHTRPLPFPLFCNWELRPLARVSWQPGRGFPGHTAGCVPAQVPRLAGWLGHTPLEGSTALQTGPDPSLQPPSPSSPPWVR